jgi:hypothetical protein
MILVRFEKRWMTLICAAILGSLVDTANGPAAKPEATDD